jgi:hypothetical protein
MRAPLSSLTLKVRAIRNINNALQQPGSVPNDYTVVAVATITLLEVIATISMPEQSIRY